MCLSLILAATSQQCLIAEEDRTFVSSFVKPNIWSTTVNTFIAFATAMFRIAYRQYSDWKHESFLVVKDYRTREYLFLGVFVMLERQLTAL